MMDFQRQLFVALTLLLVGFGLLMVYSASVTSWPTQFERVYLSRHLMFLSIGLVAAIIAGTRPPEFWKHVAPWLFVLTIMLLLAVLVPGIGSRVKGAQRWVRIAGISVQPSELAKIALPLMLCWILHRNRSRLNHLVLGTIPFAIPTLIAVTLVLIEPDLGTALFLLGGATLVLLAGGWPLRNFVLGGAAAVPACLSILVMKPYQRQRVVGFFETWADFEAAPYQLQQSLVSMGSGGLLGVGLGRGWQKLSFLPEANTDFVFAVIGEELGLLGTLSLLALWCGLYLNGLRMLNRLDPGSFSFVAGFVLLTQVVGQALLNVAVVTAMVPPKGISHPLISAGGSNLIVSLLSLAIVYSLTREAAPEASPIASR
ncbi:MAG: cell cycle protein [Schlesneria sp.]|nr:cell cycle protein [Schlesneria sp.]